MYIMGLITSLVSIRLTLLISTPPVYLHSILLDQSGGGNIAVGVRTHAL